MKDNSQINYIHQIGAEQLQMLHLRMSEIAQRDEECENPELYK